jgi:serine protease Do
MKRLFYAGPLALAAALVTAPSPRAADESFAPVAVEVNEKLVKVFGAGGIRGLASYGTGLIVSPDGYILTVNSHILDTVDLRVHMPDGTRYHAEVVCVEPELDVALVKIKAGREKVDDLKYFDVFEAAKRPLAEAGAGILAFSNEFQIATRDEPMSVQRGVVAAYARLHGKIGIFDAPFTGNVYVVDAITNNPGAGGGVITTRKGELLGIIGKELRNELTNTWINYAVPIGATVEAQTPEGKKYTVSILDLVEKKEKYKPIDPNKKKNEGGGGYHGIVLVPDLLERTPPYVDDVDPDSPAQKAGLRPDDLIVYVDGLPVPSIAMFKEIVGKYRPGTEVKFEVRRGDKLETKSLTLVADPKGVKPPPKKPDEKPDKEK